MLPYRAPAYAGVGGVGGALVSALFQGLQAPPVPAAPTAAAVCPMAYAAPDGTWDDGDAQLALAGAGFTCDTPLHGAALFAATAGAGGIGGGEGGVADGDRRDAPTR